MNSQEELELFRLSQGTLDGWVVQEFLEGPHFRWKSWFPRRAPDASSHRP